jgi:hypothetical protein
VHFKPDSNPTAKTDLNLDEKSDCGLLEDGDAFDVVGDLHELAEGEGLVLFEFGMHV